MKFLSQVTKKSRRIQNDDKSIEMSSLVEVKSKFDAEFRRFSVQKDVNANFSDFQSLIEKLHHLTGTIFLIFYTDPKDGDLLPINNDDNLRCALFNARPLIRILVQRKDEINESIKIRHKNTLFGILTSPSRSISISNPQNFRQVSAIIDVDIVPKTCRRVRLLKHGSDKPLGFYIRDGTSIRATTTTSGLETTPGIFVSRLVPGGLAESSGLLSVNDEIIEVNGIEVSGKTLDQVTDMMIANSSNLIITVKPENPRTNPHQSSAATTAAAAVRRGSIGRSSQLSSSSRHSVITTCSDNDDKFDDQDEIKDHTFKMPHSEH